MPRSFSQLRRIYVDDMVADNDIRNISFFSSSSGYVAFARNVGYTTDSGRTFIKKYITNTNVNFNGYSVNLTFGFNINGVKAFSRDTLFAYGHYGRVPAILYSVDGANTFRLVFHQQYNGVFSDGIKGMVFPADNAEGYAIDANRIIRTQDRGGSWRYTSDYDNAEGIYESMIDAGNGRFIVYGTGSTSNGRILQYFNGSRLNLVALPCCGTLKAASFLSTGRGWIVVNEDDVQGVVYYTTNWGNSWRKMSPAQTGIPTTKIQFVNDSVGYALYGLYEVYKTSDSGKVWEPVPRDNSYSYLNYTHNAIQAWNEQQFWVGGGQGFLEISTNAGGNTHPCAYFSIDTINLYQDSNVKLTSYGKAGYTYEWFRNDTLLSHAACVSYIHNKYNLLDAIKLVVHKDTFTDTLVRYQAFSRPVILQAFSPMAATPGKTVILSGYQFIGTYSVTFGGIPASSFRVVNDSTIWAVVGSGASGEVVVTAPNGKASLPGFTLIPLPVFTSFVPTAVKMEDTVVLKGRYLSTTKQVTFGGQPATSFVVVSDTLVKAIAGSGEPGNIVITTEAGTATLSGFTLYPTIGDFLPKSGTTAEVLSISGGGFTGTTSVTVGGVSATFTVDSSSHITAIAGDGGSGDVVVTTPAGSSRLTGYAFKLPPVITTVMPTKGPVGSTVTINGQHFRGQTDANIVMFGGVRAAVTSATTTALTVTVPYGATYDLVSVSIDHLTAYSNEPFHITFADGGSITAQSFKPKSDFHLAGYFPVSALSDVSIGDIDGDGKLDAAVADYSMARIVLNTTTDDSITLSEPVSIDGGVTPVGVQLGDIDGDGLPELGIYDADSSHIYIYQNRSVPGTVIFKDSILLNGYNVRFLDMDKDGKTDLIAGGYVYRNSSYIGHLSFVGPAEVGITGNIVSITDMDRDGLPDVLAFSTGANKLTIARNISVKGTVAFEPAQEYAMDYPHGLATGDVDGDGYPDVASDNPDGHYISVFRNTSSPGHISLAAAVDLQAGISPASPVFTDIDGDGKVDLLHINSYEGERATMSIFKNISTPGDIRFIDRTAYQDSNWGMELAAADFNHDGKPDVMTLSQGQGYVSFFRNKVTPSPSIYEFSPRIGDAGTVVTIKGANFRQVSAVTFGGVPAVSYTIISDSMLLATVGNGTAGDVAVTNSYGTDIRKGFSFGIPPVIMTVSPVSGPVGTMLTISGHYFSAIPDSNTVYIGKVRATVLSADANKLKVQVPAGITYEPVSVTVRGLTAYSNEQFTISGNAKNEAFNNASFSARIDKSGSSLGIVADLNNDGKLEILYTRFNLLCVLPNISTTGAISFGALQTFTAGNSANRLTTGDIDGDGLIDVIIANWSMSYISYLRNNSSGDTISFDPVKQINLPYGVTAAGIIIDDIDLDGKPDVVLSSYNGRSFNVLRNNTTSAGVAFDDGMAYPLDFYPGALTVSDYDGDGKKDVLVPGGDNHWKVYKNISSQGEIRFTFMENISVPNGSANNNTVSGDLNGDGLADIATSDIQTGSVGVMLNQSSNGQMRFKVPLYFPAGVSTSYVSINDLDGDGKPDLIANNTAGVAVLKNTSTIDSLSFLAPMSYASPGAVFTGTTGDMDGDGKPELLAFQYDGITSIFQNQVTDSKQISLCAGLDTTLYAGAVGTSYRWQINTGTGFSNVADDTTYSGSQTAMLHLHSVPAKWNNCSFRCLADDNSGPVYGFKVTTTVTPGVTAFASYMDICQGQSITFTSMSTNNDFTTKFGWLVNGVPNEVITNQFSSNEIRDGDVVQAVVTTGATCFTKNADTSAPMKINVTRPIIPVVKLVTADSGYVNESTIINVQGNDVPDGCLLQLMRSVDGDAFEVYRTLYYSSGASFLITDNNTVSRRQYYTQLSGTTYNGYCEFHFNIVSDTVTTWIRKTESIVDTIRIAVCSDADTVLTTSLSGTVYQWQENRGQGFTDISDNDDLMGTKTATLRLLHISESANGYQYRCRVGEQSKEYFSLSVEASVITSTSITYEGGWICKGSPVTFTASSKNAGDMPSYQWLVNRTNTGATGKEFTTSALRFSDTVSVVCISSARCVSNSPDTTVGLVPYVVEFDPLVEYRDSTLFVTNYNASSEFSWQMKDSSDVWIAVYEGTTSYKPVTSGTYRVALLVGSCSWVSDEWVIRVADDDVDGSTSIGSRITPNPVGSTLHVSGLQLSDSWETLEITSLTGAVRSTAYNVVGLTHVVIDVQTLPKGYYLAVLKRKKGKSASMRFIKI
ncbi:FG-GAP-like repeat-containing protein [Chitinophaga ginsengisoli]|uniref:FG-GAP-like repeat-containing protein n=1 Tax=Chitinophaga ginsengisoli TaxID=363837 RepID=UPI001475C4EB|nr:FG-GAP-like repeat-containing protein [Chitinophaga ginsengisoli]